MVHERTDVGERGGELVADLFPGPVYGCGVGLSGDRAEHRSDHVSVGLGDMGEQVAGEVNPAPLVARTLEGPLQRRDQPEC